LDILNSNDDDTPKLFYVDTAGIDSREEFGSAAQTGLAEIVKRGEDRTPTATSHRTCAPP
jgi:hypothetical protein